MCLKLLGGGFVSREEKHIPQVEILEKRDIAVLVRNEV